jgi:hypothetical protein
VEEKVMRKDTEITTLQPAVPDLLDLGKAAGGFPGIFSCNRHHHVWPFATWSCTPVALRKHLQGAIPLLDEVVGVVLSVRPEGGRFRINDRGVWLAATERQVISFTPAVWHVA